MDVVEGCNVETDKDGMVLSLDGDFMTVCDDYISGSLSVGISLRLPQNVAENLHRTLSRELGL